ncbi:hypothetical protein LTR36_007719 [Oleoguttula mirabilis]|uniref:Uncharacterized protein n=1 Tax=Oleoguttula mirabilis TaxID=1507867 RepID=A0AAV9JUJ6_9PEZI|nr:hypothetical protein LTR36_007719 [Oleoguttula mirabilis]
MAHSSMFSYNITRPYPMRWFTPLCIIGFIIFTVLFSFLNFVSTGYTLVVQESSNPNATVDSGVWMHHWPSFLTSKVQPTCQTVNLPVGSKFFTNQTALTYTLTDVWQPQAGGAGAGYGIAPSLSYYNNVIENCSVNSIEIDFAAMDRSANQFAYSEWGAVVRSYATCEIIDTNGSTKFNLTQEYDYVPPTVSFSTLYEFLGTNFLTRNKTDKASLYWGESMMSMYWAYTTRQMQDIRANQTSNGLPGIRRGTCYYYLNDDQTVTNITQLNFFEVDFRFIVDKGQGDFDVIYPGSYGRYQDYTSVANLIKQGSYPNIWMSADILAKAAYSTVLTDLGQVSATPNILTDSEYLHHFTSNFSEARHSIANAYPGPATQAYGTEGTGPLGTTPSVISTKYLCQVPQRKSAGNLFVAILIADLVLLQALWYLFQLGVEALFLRRRPSSNNCVGCAVQPAAMMGGYREVAPEVRRDDKALEELEMSGLRSSRRPRESSTHTRSISQQRLIRPESMDLGHRF